jgi:2-oxoglutarate ferredoxin oxidoreductase subunit alpha
MDYASATRGGCHGGYRNIVLAPASVQEVHDLVQLAFHLADKYCNPVILLSDGIIGTMIEPLELRTLEFDPLPEKDWALRGKARQKDGKRRLLTPGQGLIPTPRNPSYGALLQTLYDKFQQMTAQEVRYESLQVEDADLILVAYGYAARVSQEAMGWARKEGLKVGMIRPITVWPFPTEVVRAQAERGARFLVVEDSLGQMVADVEAAVLGRAEIQLVSALERHESMEGGAIYPEKVLERIKKMAAA